MARLSVTGGVIPAGNRIRFDLHVEGKRFRPTVRWLPNEANLKRARERIVIYRAQIAAGTFSFLNAFPEYRFRKRLGSPPSTQTCSEVIDRFLKHCEARVARDDLAYSTAGSYRQILKHTWIPKIGVMPFLGVRYSTLEKIADAQKVSKKTYNNIVSAIRSAFDYGYRDHPEQRNPATFLKFARIRRRDRPAKDPFGIREAESVIVAHRARWGEAQGNYDEFRFFSGLRPSEQIALLVSDFDPVHGTLSVTKSRARRRDRNTTKTGESRQVELCPRAIAVLTRHLMLRECIKQAGRINHEHLFFDRDGRPFPDTKNPYRRWRSTFQDLQIRYRPPYMARHSFISWNLMIGRNPVRLAEQHGHSPETMLRFYAAWAKNTREDEIEEIRRAIYLSDKMSP